MACIVRLPKVARKRFPGDGGNRDCGFVPVISCNRIGDSAGRPEELACLNISFP